MNAILTKLLERWASKKMGVVGALLIFLLQPEVQVEVKAIAGVVVSIWTVVQGQYDKAKLAIEKSKDLAEDFKETREEKKDEDSN